MRTGMVQQNYNEYKYHVANDSLAYIIDVLNSLYGQSDPFPQGVVDSIYYDTQGLHFYQQCLNGNSQKTKFRIRGYGDGQFNQVHQKDKDLFTVSKRKQKILPVSMLGEHAPEWHDLLPFGDDCQQFVAIRSRADLYGELVPVVRVRYQRLRFRAYDYRMTLDTNIEIEGLSNSWSHREHYGVLPDHVLEIKTVDPRPHLPLLGLMRLPQISFSKFLMGMNYLLTGDSRTY